MKVNPDFYRPAEVELLLGNSVNSNRNRMGKRSFLLQSRQKDGRV